MIYACEDETGCCTLVKETAGELSQHHHEVASRRMYLAHAITDSSVKRLKYLMNCRILQNSHAFCKMHLQSNFARSSGSLEIT